MASLNADKKGNRRIQFKGSDGKRKTIYLGKLPKRDCETVKNHVEYLLVAATSGSAVDIDTANWLLRITDELHEKLAATGLVEPRDTTTVSGLIKAFLATNAHAKPATLVVWKIVGKDLQTFFDAEQPVRGISRGKAEAFRQWLIQRGLAATTVHKRLQFARQFFAHAARNELIEKNPFKGISHKSGNPQKRQRYISVEDTQKLIDAAPNWVWRTIIALARFGGLRCPSEVLSLRLTDIDWQNGAVRVISPKTEGHGQGSRMIPVFTQLRPHLLEAAEMAEIGQEHVIPENLYLPAAKGPKGWVNCNLRTTFKKIVDRAGLEPWPRLFHNLRASCESDLAREYPITTVCKWIGNTVSIAARHYVQVTDADFQRASRIDSKARKLRCHYVVLLRARNNKTPFLPRKTRFYEAVQMSRRRAWDSNPQPRNGAPHFQ